MRKINTNISNYEMKYIIRIVKSLENFGLFEDLVRETIQNKAKEQKVRWSIVHGKIVSIVGSLLT